MKNPATLLIMSIMILTIFTFLACEEKGKKAEPGGDEAHLQQTEKSETEQAVAPKAEEEYGSEAWLKAAKEAEAKEKAACPDKKIGSPITAEAVFEGISTDVFVALFRLNNGEELELQLGEGMTEAGEEKFYFEEKAVYIKKGDKVSITYQKEQLFGIMAFDPGDFGSCYQIDYLKSVTILPK